MDSDLHHVSNHIFKAVYMEDVMVVAQTDREDDLKLFKILQTAEDSVNTKGRNIKLTLISSSHVNSELCTVSLQGVHTADVEDIEP